MPARSKIIQKAAPMPTRSETIQKAASLPVGDPERRAILSGLSRTGKVDMSMRRPGTISVNVRVAIRSGVVGNITTDAQKVLDNVERALALAKKTLESEGARVDAISMPPLSKFGLNTGRGGVFTDHFWHFKYESPARGDEADAQYGNQVIKVLEKALKTNGIKV